MHYIINRVIEHDIDMILLRSFRDDSEVKRLFLKKCGIPSASLVRIENSIYATDGREEDVVIELSDGDRTINILVEDKIDAPFQKNQLEDYLKRGNNLDNCHIVLLAPEEYYLNVGEWIKDKLVFIPYEDFEMALRKDGDDFSAEVVKKALEEDPDSRGPKVFSDEVTAFYKEYKEYVNGKGLDITYNGHDQRGINSNWVYYVADNPNVRIIHKGRQGKVEVICAGKPEELREVPKMDFTGKFNEQRSVLDRVIAIVKSVI